MVRANQYQVMVDNYASCQDYYDRDQSSSRPAHVQTLAVSLTYADLRKYSILNGQFGGHVPSKPGGVRFYSSLIDFSLDGSGVQSQFRQSDDFRFAENTYKTTVSFFLGMIAARAVYHKSITRGQVGVLLHLSDPCSAYVTSSTGRKPDFVGVDSKGTPCLLMEAKGSSQSSVGSATVRHAASQLAAVKQIEYTDASGATVQVLGRDIKKQIVTCSFPRLKQGGDKVMRFANIDPAEEGDVELRLDLDVALVDHYAPILSCFEGIANPEIVTYRGARYEVVDFDDRTSVGLAYGLRQAVQSRQQGRSRDIFEVLRSLEFEDKVDFVSGDWKDISAEGDGVFLAIR